MKWQSAQTHRVKERGRVSPSSEFVCLNRSHFSGLVDFPLSLGFPYSSPVEQLHSPSQGLFNYGVDLGRILIEEFFIMR